LNRQQGNRQVVKTETENPEKLIRKAGTQEGSGFLKSGIQNGELDCKGSSARGRLPKQKRRESRLSCPEFSAFLINQ
jgi:hypothetical protein